MAWSGADVGSVPFVDVGAVDAELAGIVERFRRHAIDHRARSPLTARLADAVADRPTIAAILLDAPPEQRLPVLLLAALHDQVLADPGCELARWFPTASPSGARHPDDGLGAAVEAHCRRLGSELRRTVATRSTQTNEVGRCGVLLPVLARVADEVGPLGLLDVGASAGLNLLVDRIDYEYAPGGRVGHDGPLRLTVATRGRVPVPSVLPSIATRLGLDREPVDLTDPDAVRWLRACVWPDQTDRATRLDLAIGIAAVERPTVRRGDAVDDLAVAVDQVGASAHPVVVNSWVLNYLPDERRHRYVDELDRIGGTRDLSWVFLESAAVAGLPVDPSLRGSDVTVVGSVRWRDGRRTIDHLGVAHPHGYWLHWAGSPA